MTYLLSVKNKLCSHAFIVSEFLSSKQYRLLLYTRSLARSERQNLH